MNIFSNISKLPASLRKNLAFICFSILVLCTLLYFRKHRTSSGLDTPGSELPRADGVESNGIGVRPAVDALRGPEPGTKIPAPDGGQKPITVPNSEYNPRLASALTNLFEMIRLQDDLNLFDYGIAALPLLPQLRSTLSSESNQIMKIAIGEVIGSLGTNAVSALPEIENAILDSSDGQEAAIRSLLMAVGRMGPAAATEIPVVTRLLSDPFEMVRSQALLTLEEIGPNNSELAEKISQCLNDPSSEVRAIAARVLTNLSVK